jgi:hypothetical protein
LFKASFDYLVQDIFRFVRILRVVLELLTHDLAFLVELSSRNLVTCRPARVRSCDMHRDVLNELLKFFATRYEIAFAVDLDEDSDLSTHVDVGADSTLAVTRPAFFPAVAMPFFLKISIAAASSPFASTKAFLQSTIPAPDFSRSDLTALAVTSAITQWTTNFSLSTFWIS